MLGKLLMKVRKEIRGEEGKKYATANSVVNSDVMREGIVLRAMDDSDISFKNVSREYLLKHNE
jgi:hypothetical protein